MCAYSHQRTAATSPKYPIIRVTGAISGTRFSTRRCKIERSARNATRSVVCAGPYDVEVLHLHGDNRARAALIPLLDSRPALGSAGTRRARLPQACRTDKRRLLRLASGGGPAVPATGLGGAGWWALAPCVERDRPCRAALDRLAVLPLSKAAGGPRGSRRVAGGWALADSLNRLAWPRCHGLEWLRSIGRCVATRGADQEPVALPPRERRRSRGSSMARVQQTRRPSCASPHVLLPCRRRGRCLDATASTREIHRGLRIVPRTHDLGVAWDAGATPAETLEQSTRSCRPRRRSTRSRRKRNNTPTPTSSTWLRSTDNAQDIARRWPATKKHTRCTPARRLAIRLLDYVAHRLGGAWPKFPSAHTCFSAPDRRTHRSVGAGPLRLVQGVALRHSSRTLTWPKPWPEQAFSFLISSIWVRLRLACRGRTREFSTGGGARLFQSNVTMAHFGAWPVCCLNQDAARCEGFCVRCAPPR
jgi:hypothetical protein